MPRILIGVASRINDLARLNLEVDSEIYNLQLQVNPLISWTAHGTGTELLSLAKPILKFSGSKTLVNTRGFRQWRPVTTQRLQLSRVLERLRKRAALPRVTLSHGSGAAHQHILPSWETILQRLEIGIQLLKSSPPGPSSLLSTLLNPLCS